MRLYKNARIGFLVFVLFLGCMSHVRAQNASLEEEYAVLVKLSQTMPEDYDFARLREVFKGLPDYKPYSLQPVMDFRTLNKEIKESPDKEEELTKVYFRKYFAMPEAHSRLLMLYKSKNDTRRMQYHEWMLRGLFESLLSTGDGQSAETAYKVLSVSEEYLIARGMIDKKTQKQNLEKIEDRVYDVLSGKSIENGEDVSLWFDITDIFGKSMD